jgi:hypothetical protein
MSKILHHFETLFIIFTTCISLGGCVGDTKKINKEGIQKQNIDKTNRDRTPDAPRINIPTQNF